MAAARSPTLRSLVRTDAPAALLDSDGRFLVVATTEPGCTVVRIDEDGPGSTSQPLRLSTHLQRRAPTAICLGTYSESPDDLPSTRLAVASKDAVVLWDLEDAHRSSAAGEPLLEPLELLTGQGHVDTVALAPGCATAAVCTGSTARIIDVASVRVIYILEGHRGPITAAGFSPTDPSLLLTASEDRTVHAWSLARGECTLRSPVLSAATPTALAVDPGFPRASVGFSDGTVRCVDLSCMPGFRELQGIDLGRAVVREATSRAEEAGGGVTSPSGEFRGPRVISSTPGGAGGAGGGARGGDVLVSGLGGLAVSDEHQQAAHHGMGIVHLCYGREASEGANGDAYAAPDDSLGGLLARPPPLGVASLGCLAVLDGATFDVLSLAPMLASSVEGRSAPLISAIGGAAGACAVFPDARGGVGFAVGGSFTPVVALGALDAHRESTSAGPGDLGPRNGLASPPGSGEPLSVFARQPLPPTSPIYFVESAKPPPARSASERKPAGAAARRGLQKTNSDKPVTFHTSIKSSGYGMLYPKNVIGQRPNAPIKNPTAPRSRAPGTAALSKQYPVACGPLTHLQERNCMPRREPAHRGPIVRLDFSPDGSRLATASIDRTARALRLPVSKHRGDGSNFMGHDAPLTDVSWAQSGTMLLTASVDRTARVWQLGKSDPVLILSHVGREAPTGGAGTHREAHENPRFLHEVRAARFLHMDRIIALACGNKLHLYRYEIGAEKAANDLDRLRASNRYRQLAALPTAAQAITALTAANRVLSHLVLAATSNRAVEVIDLAAGRTARTLPDAHARPVHTLALNDVSPYAQHAAEAHELFITAAADGLVKLWDLRSQRCARVFSGHANRQQPVGASLSPCMRWLAAGSEDRAAVMWDLGSGMIVHRARGHPDVVSDVAWHPLHPQLATACSDGHVRFFSEEAG
ncbi:unnamed protein product [Pedinophyceae sp. YPF-701]|nr:unnamed protein product [Pedinophyceae sp. YPF-701]